MSLSEMQKAEAIVEPREDLSRSSCYYEKHFRHFEIDTTGKNLQQLVTEFRTRVGEIFIRNCHLEPENYSFEKFRSTRSYKLQRELNFYLLELSEWLFRFQKYPPGLKRAFLKWSSFRNPYQKFRINTSHPQQLFLLDDLQLTMLYNLRIVEQDFYLPSLVLEEFEKRKISIPKIKDFSLLRRVEIITGSRGSKLRYIRNDRQIRGTNKTKLPIINNS